MQHRESGYILTGNLGETCSSRKYNNFLHGIDAALMLYNLHHKDSRRSHAIDKFKSISHPPDALKVQEERRRLTLNQCTCSYIELSWNCHHLPSYVVSSPRPP